MNTLSRKSLIGAFALVASLSAPLAFAQQAEQAPPAEQTAQSTDAAAAAATDATTAQASEPAATAAAPQKKSWSDVDVDKDGNLSKTEASSVPALGQVFDKADSNADGSLTADEYKAYVAKAQSSKPAKHGG
ncbi:EF-hand domain-containing protein [Lysobacter sp. 5GHs7-4]|uniref:EF-hand domain-containing protein n=1 Tax=Lysobacter sp. 5GHs7-4 TaxID=2904253 RepID=UPI001E64DF83|nr:EF-hand domain-containing protein [Lysobacter sp. 5GHs7-4]UHQ22794.1 EF-hand domain-containing protein [Lysobacter sp. 5GHs7-4]